MKILKIESVVPDLIDCGMIECFLANFKFNREYNRPAHKHHVNAPSHSRNVELEEDRPGQIAQRRLEKLNLCKP